MTTAQDNAPAQDNIYLKQANIDIDNLQKSFLAAVREKKKMDKGVKDLLTRFLSIGTDSIQTLIKNDGSIPDDRKLLALNSHAYFPESIPGLGVQWRSRGISYPRPKTEIS
jgi:hypothetical protein